MTKMATKEDVEQFLKRLKEKIKIFDIIFRDDRGKNMQTLAALEITPTYRKQVILNIETPKTIQKDRLWTLSIKWAKCGYLAKTSKDTRSI